MIDERELKMVVQKIGLNKNNSEHPKNIVNGKPLNITDLKNRINELDILREKISNQLEKDNIIAMNSLLNNKVDNEIVYKMKNKIFEDYGSPIPVTVTVNIDGIHINNLIKGLKIRKGEL